MTDLTSLTNFSEQEKEILTEVSKETLDVLQSKASGFDFFKRHSRELKEALIACILDSKEGQLIFTDHSLSAARDYELEVVTLPTNKVILSIRKK